MAPAIAGAAICAASLFFAGPVAVSMWGMGLACIGYAIGKKVA